jgi:hypothetical protein
MRMRMRMRRRRRRRRWRRRRKTITRHISFKTAQIFQKLSLRFCVYVHSLLI